MHHKKTIFADDGFHKDSVLMKIAFDLSLFQQTFTYSKSTRETQEKNVKYIQN